MSRYQTTLSGFPARSEQQTELAVNVAFTSGRATAAALRYAAELAGGLRARLQVILPQVVPYGRDLNDPDVSPEFIANRALEAARAAGVDADVNVVLCRDQAEGLHHALGEGGLVVVGGGGSWWQFGERSLVHQLAGQGHKVLFVEAEKAEGKVSL